MIIKIDAIEKTTFKLTPEQGNQIRELIVQQIDVSFREYCYRKVGLEDSNVSAMLMGKRNMTVAMLRRLFSGTRIEIEECTLNFTLENTSGGIVKPAALLTLEEMLSLQEQNDSSPPWDEDLPQHLTEESHQTRMTPPVNPQNLAPSMNYPSPDPSSSSEKPQGKLKTLLASRSWEKADESSDSSSTD